MSNEELITIDLSHFPMDERFAQIPGKLFLTDNSNNNDSLRYSHSHAGYPVQVKMTVSFLVTEGWIDIVIGLDEYRISPGQFILVLSGSILQIKASSDDVKCIFMAISPDFINPTSNARLAVEMGWRLKENPLCTLTPKELETSLTIYKMMAEMLRDSKFQFKEDVARNYLNIMFSNTLQKLIDTLEPKEVDKPSSRKEEIFFSFIAAVKEFYKEERSIGFYASKIFISPKYLSSVVHEVSGKHATEWINDLVVLEAKAMLRSPGATVKEVTHRLCFANQSFFAKFFKQHTGYTPREYMNM